MRMPSLALRRVVLLLLLGSAGCCASQKYAVLISTNQTQFDDMSIHSEWWYDLVYQYKMLHESGFTDDRIYVLYGDGHDFPTTHAAYDSQVQFGHAITDMPVSKANVAGVFSLLGSKMTKRDYLYVWWMGHGGGSGPGQCDLTMYISNTGETVMDHELKTYMSAAPNYRKRSISIMTCHSGGLLNDFNTTGDPTVVLASSTCSENSYDAPTTCNGIVEAEFNYTDPSALRKKNVCGTPVTSDTTVDGFVSLQEVQQYNALSMTMSTPQLGDPSALAATTFPAKSAP